MKIRIWGGTFLILFALALSACHMEYFQLDNLSTEIELEPRLVAPIVYGSLSMKDVVERFDSSGFVGVEESGLIYLAYSDTLVEVQADTLAEIPDQIYHEFYLDPEIGDDPIFIAGNLGDTAHYFKSNRMAFRLEDGDRIDSVIFKNGSIRLIVESSFRHRGYVVITSSQILDPSGQDLELMVPISDDSGNFMDSVSVPADRYQLRTLDVGDSSVIQIDYHLALINSGNTIDPGENCHVSTGLLDMDFYGLYGHIGSRDLISQGGELDIPIFEDFPELSALKLRDPRISIFTASSIGVPFEIEMDSVSATSSEGTSIDLEFYSGHPFQIPGPDLADIGETYTGEIHINMETSNFPDLLNLAPSHITYKVMGRTKPEGTEREHFILDTSRFMLEAEVLVPLDLKVTGLALSDTTEMFLDMEESGPEIQDLSITIGTQNDLPLELGLQIYLMDNRYQVLDSVFVDEEVILAASVVDQDGLLVDGSTERHEAVIPADKLINWQDAAFMEIVASLISSSGGQTFVKILEEYSLEYDVSISGQVRINTEEL